MSSNYYFYLVWCLAHLRASLLVTKQGRGRSDKCIPSWTVNKIDAVQEKKQIVLQAKSTKPQKTTVPSPQYLRQRHLQSIKAVHVNKLTVQTRELPAAWLRTHAGLGQGKMDPVCTPHSGRLTWASDALGPDCTETNPCDQLIRKGPHTMRSNPTDRIMQKWTLRTLVLAKSSCASHVTA